MDPDAALDEDEKQDVADDLPVPGYNTPLPPSQLPPDVNESLEGGVRP